MASAATTTVNNRASPGDDETLTEGEGDHMRSSTIYPTSYLRISRLGQRVEMSRALPQPPLSSLPLPALMALATFPESMTDRTPREWFDRARHEADLAVLAERKGKREEVFVAYSRCCTAYANVKMHPEFKEVRKGDAHWTQRVKDFAETYEAYYSKAKELKEALRLRDEKEPRPTPSRAPSTGGPEVSSMGSIADRMKALSGKGLDVGPSKRPGDKSSSSVISTNRHRAASNASASSSDKQRPRGPTGTKLPPHSLPKLTDGLPSPATASSSTSGTGSGSGVAPGRSRSNSKAIPPPLSPSPSEPKSPIHIQSPPTSLTSSIPTSAKLPPVPAPKPDALTIHHSPHHPPPEAPAAAAAGDEDDFEKAFPSLSEFGKQFETDDFQPQANGLVGPYEITEESENEAEAEVGEVKFPDVPSFNLPSVPITAPRSGLPPPPSRPDKLGSSPPAAEVNIDRAASSPNVAALKHDPPPSLRPGPPPMANGHSHANGHSNGPSPQPSGSSDRPPLPPKPKFPLSNSILPEVLRSYIINPSVDMLVLDIRPEEDHKKGYVGKEYESKGYITNVVWIDPTVLMRNDMNSVKLEDSLSLLPDQQRRYFENRHKADLVVVYDATSTTWPKDAQPLSKLWDIIYGNEFGKKLQRMPVLLVGGQEHWSEYVRRRQAAYTPVVDGGVVVPNGAPRRDDAVKKANRNAGVYQPSSYKESYSSDYNYGQPSRSYLPSPPPTSSSSRHGASNSLSYPIPSIAPPPQTHPGPGARRRSDYIEHSTQPYSGYTAPHATSSRHNGIDYPAPHALGSISKPPPIQSHGLERHGVVRSQSIRALDLMAREEGEVRYWNDIALGMTGLKNIGNTCYMNSTLQCLSSTYPFTSYFLDGSFKKAINFSNPLGTKGNLASAFAELLKALWAEEYTFLSPVTFRRNIITFAEQFSGTDQHDSQEFLSFVLDGLHEDLNRIKVKPAPVEMTPDREARLESLPPEIASEQEWEIYRQRNDSFIVDLFQGQYRNRLECLTCHKTSTTYDTFMYMSLPVPAGKKAMVLQELIDEFVKAEIMEKEDAWHCPRCKVSRTASKTLTISRLPPVLLIQLKRFSTKNGVFWDKSETPVIFPVKSLDLSRYVPVRRSTGREDLDDPRTQVGPFRYDLYSVSNHMGTLSSGHYTAYVKSAKGWYYCDDSKITPAQDKDVVTKPAYILFYKRVRA